MLSGLMNARDWGVDPISAFIADGLKAAPVQPENSRRGFVCFCAENLFQRIVVFGEVLSNEHAGFCVIQSRTNNQSAKTKRTRRDLNLTIKSSIRANEHARISCSINEDHHAKNRTEKHEKINQGYIQCVVWVSNRVGAGCRG
jgi:hypothetical protein